MEGSGAILLQLSTLKDMLDKVNDEIEANIQVTREIESEIVKCGEIESALAARESELIKLVYLSQFELRGLVSVTGNSRNSVTAFMEEIKLQTKKRDELIVRLDNKRKSFTESCIQIQRCIESEECSQLQTLLLEKETLEDDIFKLDQTQSKLEKSAAAVSEETLKDLHSFNSAVEADIQRGHAENEQLMKQIDELRTTLLSTIDGPW